MACLLFGVAGGRAQVGCMRTQQIEGSQAFSHARFKPNFHKRSQKQVTFPHLIFCPLSAHFFNTSSTLSHPWHPRARTWGLYPVQPGILDRGNWSSCASGHAITHHHKPCYISGALSQHNRANIMKLGSLASLQICEMLSASGTDRDTPPGREAYRYACLSSHQLQKIAPALTHCIWKQQCAWEQQGGTLVASVAGSTARCKPGECKHPCSCCQLPPLTLGSLGGCCWFACCLLLGPEWW